MMSLRKEIEDMEVLEMLANNPPNRMMDRFIEEALLERANLPDSTIEEKREIISILRRVQSHGI